VEALSSKENWKIIQDGQRMTIDSVDFAVILKQFCSFKLGNASRGDATYAKEQRLENGCTEVKNTLGKGS
jgi:hypothetical protein